MKTVDLRRYDDDFRTLVDQVDYGASSTPGLVRVRAYADFKSWVMRMREHYDDRHWTDGIMALVESGRLPPEAEQNYEVARTIKPMLEHAGLSVDDVYRAGLEAHVNALVRAISEGQDIPPVIARNGRPIDGRHRVLAALRLKKKTIPVLELSEGHEAREALSDRADRCDDARVWYHGSRHRFDAFQPHVGAPFGGKDMVVPTFLTCELETARAHAGANGWVYTVRPKPKQVFRGQDLWLAEYPRWWPPQPEEMSSIGRRLYEDLEAGRVFDDVRGEQADDALRAIARSYYDIMESGEMKQWILDHGYDAFTVREAPGAPVSLAVMDPSRLQIEKVQHVDETGQQQAGEVVARTFRRGDRVFFEYHCWQDEKSADAKLWRHTRQWATVVRVMRSPEVDPEVEPMYRLRFDDGFRADANRDEVTEEPLPEPEKRGVVMPGAHESVADLSSMSVEQLEREPTDVLDRLAFGVGADDVVEVPVSKISIRYAADYENAQHEVSSDAIARKYLAINETVPVVIDIRDDGQGGRVEWVLDDGHHRYVSAQRLHAPTLRAVIKISAHPINEILRQRSATDAPKDRARWQMLARRRKMGGVRMMEEESPGRRKKIRVDKLIVGRDALAQALWDVGAGRVSRTTAPMEVWYKPESGGQPVDGYLLTDGHHRLVELLLRGPAEPFTWNEVDAKQIGSGYNDYWRTPAPEERFVFTKTRYSGLEDLADVDILEKDAATLASRGASEDDDLALAWTVPVGDNDVVPGVDYVPELDRHGHEAYPGDPVRIMTERGPKDGIVFVSKRILQTDEGERRLLGVQLEDGTRHSLTSGAFVLLENLYAREDRRTATLDPRIDALVTKYMAILGVTERPTIAFRQNVGSQWLGRCIWHPKEARSDIELQRSILADDTTLERIVAHEMVHHWDFTTMTPEEMEHIQALRRAGIRHDGHGDRFKRGAAIINEAMGPDFVTKYSDEAMVQVNTKPFFVLIGEYERGKLGYKWAARLSDEARWVVDDAIAHGARLATTTDLRWTQGKAKIKRYSGWNVPLIEAPLRALYDAAGPQVTVLAET